MDAVKAFNLELSGLYEVKPPISKAKMTSITKGAIKAIKFYKHVVQSVEKFILKCKPEYKVPGLYVIDSIVRQSRHQFGADRDVFAPRFAKNMQHTFINLFACPEEEKSKVIRVLNLWQKNHVFPPEVIQPLFDLADPNHPVYKEQNLIQSNGVGNQNVVALVKGSPAVQKSPATKAGSLVTHIGDQHPGAINTQLHKTLQKSGGDVGKAEGQPVRFDRKLLDFDYDDEEEEEQHIIPSPKPPPHNTSSSAIDTVGSLLSNPEVLRQLQTLQQSMSQSQQYQEIDLEKLRKLQEMKQQEEEFDKHLAQTVPNLPFAAECDLKPMMNPPPPSSQPYYMTGIQDLGVPPPGFKAQHTVFDLSSIPDIRVIEQDMLSRGSVKDITEGEIINLDQTDSRSPTPNGERYSSRRRRSRSRERSRDRGRGKDRRSKRTRSRSHSRERRRRSRSRDRERTRDRDKDREREKEKERDKEKDREKEKERRKRGLPPFKKDYLCVCSTTLWVGHLSKLVHQEELSDAFGEYGAINSIDLIPPRGCAFIVMHRRQDAARCLERLKNHKLQGKAITLAWAPGKGLKGKEFKDYWEVDLGASYIPWSKLKPDVDVELLEDGGMIDEDSMPVWLKTKIAQVAPTTIMASPHISLIPNIPGLGRPPIPSIANLDTSQPPPMPGTAMLQPPPTLPLQMVNPFQLNLGLNMPPNMMPNVPIGVPPPNMAPTSMMPNQLLGFPQGPTPGLLPPPMSLPIPNKPPPVHKPMPPFSLIQIPPAFHDDNMDVEMEDEDKLNKPPPLSDQLLASLGHNNDESSLSAALSRLNAVAGAKVDDNMADPYDKRGRENDRDPREVHSRFSSERHKENRDYRETRDHREGLDQRDRHDHRRDRSSRRGDRDDNNERNDRKDYNEKNVNERLRDVAYQDSFPSSKGETNNITTAVFEPPPEHPPSSYEDQFPPKYTNNERNDDIDAFINPEPPSEIPVFQSGNEQEVENWQSNQREEWGNPNNDKRGVWNQHEFMDNSQERQNFNHEHNIDHEQHNFDPEQHNFNMPPPGPDFERNNGPPHLGQGRGNFEFNREEPHRLPHLSVRNEIFLKEDRFLENQNDFNIEHNTYDMGSEDYGAMNEPLMDSGYGGDGGFDQGGPRFDELENQGPMFNEHDQYPPEFGGRGVFGGPEHGRHGFGGPEHSGRGFRGRDGRRGFGGHDRGKRGFIGNGPRGDFWPGRNMRGGDGFRGRGRGGPFHARGQPPGRGPRHFGPRRNDGDRNFQPRFDGPPDYFRGPKFDEPRRRGFDESRHNRRDREDRRHYRRDFEEERERHPREKRTRWGHSPKRTEEPHSEEGNSENVPNEGQSEANTGGEQVQESNEGNYDAGNSTPLHDEPQEPEVTSNNIPEKTVVESESTTEVAAEEQQ